MVKRLLAVWQETIPRYQQLVAEKTHPVARRPSAISRRQLVHLLDRQHAGKGFTRNQKHKIGYIIRDLCQELIDAHERENLKSALQ